MDVHAWLRTLCLLAALAVAAPASAQLVADGSSLTVTSANVVAKFVGADLVQCVGVATGESYLALPSDGDRAGIVAMDGLHALHPGNWTIGTDPATGTPSATLSLGDGVRTLMMTVLVDPASQELVMRVAASTSTPGLRFASWTVAGLDLTAARLIVPANSGVVVDRDNPGIGMYMQYPYAWQAQMLVVEGASGSLVLYSTDRQVAFKHLEISSRRRSTIDLTVATEAFAPLATATEVPSVEWRLKATPGPWQAAASTYRDWLWTHRPPVPNTSHPWVTNIRTVVTMSPDSSLLAPLAGQLTPAQTLLYISDWRQHAYDVSYPDYTPRAGLKAFIDAAHALGFRVMLHLDLIGVSTYHSDFAAVQAFQVRTPDTLQPMGWAWEQDPSVPHRFAFINPASAAFRSLFITRVGQGLSGLGVDAVHLDISAPMYNDGNGLIDGMSYGEGSDQLHREFGAAFPHLALGGEGENDVLYRYHAFAQAWMLTNHGGDGHPINTFLFHPHVQYYGHLSQAIARDTSFPSQWLELARRAMLPSIKVYGPPQLDAGDPDNQRLFEMIRQWQVNAFQPAWFEDWGGALVKYRGLGGAEASLTAADGVITLATAGTTQIALAHGANALVTNRFPRGWPAFDSSAIHGLDPAGYYFLDAVPRPATTHVTSLPPGVRLGPGSLVGTNFAHVEVLPPAGGAQDLVATFSSATTGITFAGQDWPLAHGAVVHRATTIAGGQSRSGLFMHVPYQAQVGGETFAEYAVTVPADGLLRFSVAVADDAQCTDGVTFRVTAEGAELWRRHLLRTGWHDGIVSLAPLSGRTVRLRLVVDPGPAWSPACDWATWSNVTLASAAGTSVAIPLALAPGATATDFTGDGALVPVSAQAVQVTDVPLPGRFTVFMRNGTAVQSGTHLAGTPFETWRAAHGNVPRASSQDFGWVTSATANGVARSPAIFAHPPDGGRSIVSWLLRLPANGALRLAWGAGLADGGLTFDGVTFSVRVNGTPYWQVTRQAPGWVDASIDLSQWQGSTILLELVTDSGPNPWFDIAYWTDPVLLTSTDPCAYTLAPGADASASGGTFVLQVTTAPGCPWRASSQAPGWLEASAAGVGPGRLPYVVLPNTGAARTGTIVLAGRTVAVTQAGVNPTTRYLAEGVTSAFFATRLALLNPVVSDASVTVSLLRDGQPPVAQQIVVPGRTRRTLDVKDVPGFADAAFATTVTSSQLLVVDRTVSWDASGYGSHAETAAPSPATTWYLAEGATHSGFDLFYLLQNPAPVPTRVRVRYLRTSGAPLEKEYALAPLSRTNIWVNVEDFAGHGRALAAAECSAVIESLDGTPIIVERAMYRSSHGRLFDAGHSSMGVTTPSTRWFLAEGATGPYFDEFVLIANPTNVDAAVQVTYLLDDGRTYSRTRTAPANARSGIWVDREEIPGEPGFPLADVAVSIVVESTNDVPLIVERAMWWPGDGDTWHEAHNSAGATESGVEWALADGEVGGPRALETYILIANTSPFEGQATVTLLFEDGTTTSRVYRLPPRSRTNAAIGPDFGDAVQGRRFGAIVESTGDVPAQIVVERAMYGNAGGVTWASGTNAVATKIR